jgi:cytochrome c556
MRQWGKSGFVAAFVAVALVAGAPGGTAQDKAATIKQRQALMKEQAEDLKAIQNYVTGGTSHDTAIAKVNELLTLPPRITGLFPPGTSIVEFPGATHAKPEIWQQWDRFKDVPVALRQAELRLANAVKAGRKEQVLDELDNVGRSGCGACHTFFRAPLRD